MNRAPSTPSSLAESRTLTTHQGAMLALHTDPIHGSPFWIERMRERAIDPAALTTLDQLCAACGPMDAEALRTRSVFDFVPACVRAAGPGLMLFDTAGTTGLPRRTAYTREDFEAAFVRPFVLAARHVGFPHGENWLWIGPSGPHVIGQAARRLPVELGSPEPFCVDFDPRWVRKLPAGSLARERYMTHILDQALDILTREMIGVLFTTPSIILRLAEQMSPAQRERINGIHYGGQRVEAVLMQQVDISFPRAMHIAGYGNTLFGCCLEVQARGPRTPIYYPCGDRLVFHPDPEGNRVRFSRFDRAFLIIDMIERDCAALALAPTDAPAVFTGAGVIDPHPTADPAQRVEAGFY